MTSSSNIKYGNQRNAHLQSRIEAREAENQNLMLTLSRERELKSNVENRLRETSTTASMAQREVGEAKKKLSENESHLQNLQRSFDTTRVTLEAERDQARYDVRALTDRVADLQHSLAMLDKNAAEKERINAIQHQEKDQTHASKEATWEQMRRMLESQIKAQGGYVDPASSQGGHPHPDYAAQTGSQAFHPSINGQQERFIDTAHDLQKEGVNDPQGKGHLAELLGHLFDMKMAEYQAIDEQPGQVPQPKPPIGHWMAQNLERAGVTCQYGTVHMAYILDRHFGVQARPKLSGRTKLDSNQQPGMSSGQSPPPSVGLDAAGGSQGFGGQGESFGRASLGVPGIITDKAKQGADSVKDAKEKFDRDRDSLHAWRNKHKVDAAGFV